VRLAFDDLERALPRPHSDQQVAWWLGTTPRHVARLRAKGLDVDQADRYATRVGLNPVEVWGDDWWQPEEVVGS
jgi:hypothetical protein